jgi:cobalt/nickel transport system permease protein
MIEEPFAEGSTLLHRMDAAAKVLAAIVFVLPTATTNSFFIAAGFGMLSLALATIARLPVMRVIKRLALVNTFTLFLLLTLPLSYGGEQMVIYSFIPVSVEGTRLALLIALKTNTILLAMIALLNTSHVAALGYGLEKLKVPLRLCYLILFTYRYIFVIEQEYRRLLRAAQMRCFSPATTIHTYRTFGYLFGMTLVKSWEQAHRVHQAMILRGFNGHFVQLSQPSMGLRSYLLMSFVSLYSLMLVWLDYFSS